MEISATGEMRPLTRKVNNSSSSLNKSAASLSKPGMSAAEKGEGDGGRRCVNHYDNIPEIRANGVVMSGCGEKAKGEEGTGDKWRKSAASVCCDSEFVDFIDNMEERRGSLKSIMR